MNSPIPTERSSPRPSFGERYEARSYAVQDDAGWFPALYGHVPGYQIDYLFRPRTQTSQPQRLRPEHMRHLTALIRYLEAPAGASTAFLIGNLSSNDPQHVPGQGGLALVCSLRVEGASDQAGRPRPVLTQCLMSIGGSVASEPLREALQRFSKRAREEGPRWYIHYSQADHSEEEALLTAYQAGFAALPAPTGAPVGPFRRRGPLPFKRLLITCPDLTLSPAVAACAARLVTVLYHSDVRWTAISNGYQAEEDGSAELEVRFVLPRSQPSTSAGTATRTLEELAKLDEDGLALLLGLGRGEASAGEGWGALGLSGGARSVWSPRPRSGSSRGPALSAAPPADVTQLIQAVAESPLGPAPSRYAAAPGRSGWVIALGGLLSLVLVGVVLSRPTTPARVTPPAATSAAPSAAVAQPRPSSERPQEVAHTPGVGGSAAQRHKRNSGVSSQPKSIKDARPRPAEEAKVVAIDFAEQARRCRNFCDSKRDWAHYANWKKCSTVCETLSACQKLGSAEQRLCIDKMIEQSRNIALGQSSGNEIR